MKQLNRNAYYLFQENHTYTHKPKRKRREPQISYIIGKKEGTPKENEEKTKTYIYNKH
jgi:hypothetical protein